jgi:dTDP-4-amino-4,6-dideoxygalactose transaminase
MITKENIEKFASWPQFEQDEIAATVKVLDSGKVNYWTGTECREFEKEFAQYVGTDYAIAMANGTVTLETALHALRIPRGAEAIMTSRTFVATATACAVRGIKPVFADIDPITQNISAETIKLLINSNTKVIICVHLAGWPCPMDEIMELAEQHGIKVIEDCAQAHGAVYKDKKVGAWGHINSFSFCQDKIMTTGGEGGMITTNDKDLWSRAWSYKDHGKSYETVYHKQHPPGFRWLHESFGTNFRMTEMQGAIGRQQLRKLDSWVSRRNHNAKRLNEAFADIKLFRLTIPNQDIYHAYYKYYVFINNNNFKEGWNRDKLMNEITALGIPCFSGSCSEIYQEKVFDRCGLVPEKRLETAKELGETSLMLLVHHTLSDKNIDDTILVVKHITALASK